MPLQIERRPGHILVHGSGLASLADAQRHFRELSSLLVAERRTTRGVRLLIDLRAATPHPPEVASHIERVLPVLYRARDRVAVVVRDSTRKHETKRSHDPSYTDVFLTLAAAEAYLGQAHTHPCSLDSPAVA
ncbi:hypothetical protein [Sphingomonas sp. BK580]|uniref:hypothetical protein n=1 Tax=Sphingomonas sp. BK580 TaxID=2586972 RepID=UPI00161809F5|nr:hypothetical protein [Sphingomonas sp. BK580]MBB3692436.1 hypothetical protein [Sphingomonas sp. BK580]